MTIWDANDLDKKDCSFWSSVGFILQRNYLGSFYGFRYFSIFYGGDDKASLDEFIFIIFLTKMRSHLTKCNWAATEHK